MVQTVSLPTGDTASFPDDMPKEQIESVLKDHLASSTPAAKESTGALGSVDAAAMGAARGSLDAIQSAGTLANNILKGGAHLLPDSIGKPATKALNLLGDIGTKTMEGAKGEVDATTDFEKQAVQENPRLYGAAATVGNVGLSTALMNTALGPVSKAIQPTINKLAPGAKYSPILTNSASQGALGAGVGAASNPNDPWKGALLGGAIGAVAGAGEGAIGEPINTAGKIISDTTDDILARGGNPHTLTNLRTIQENLKNEGKEYREEAIAEEVKQQVDAKLAPLRPDGYVPGENPLNILSDQTIARIPQTIAKNKANYDPINKASQVFTPSNYQQAVTDLKASLPKAGLPVKPVKETTIDPDTGKSTVTVTKADPLPQKATLRDMLDHRQLIDGKIRQVEAQALHGKIANTDVFPYYQIRDALNQDIHQSAESIGLGDQLKTAESFWKSDVKPLKLIDKGGNVVNNPRVAQKIMTQLSRQLQPRMPNYTAIADTANRLGTMGQGKIGWGMVENAFNKATKGSGVFKPETMQSNLTRMIASGVLKKLGGEELESTARGISTVIESLTRTKAAAPVVGKIGSLVQKATHSRLGIALLKYIGSPTATMQTKRSLVQQLLTGDLSKNVATPTDEGQ